jgi:hypothetical protein
VLEASGDRRGDRIRADDRDSLGAVVDGGIGREQRGDLCRLVAVEVVAVRVDQVRDRLAIEELRDRGCNIRRTGR